MSIGDRIKLRRKALGLTLEEVAGRLGISRQTMSRYETGIISNIPSDRMEKLAEILDTSPAYFMGWSDTASTWLTANATPVSASDFMTLPIYGTVRAGQGGAVLQETVGYDYVMRRSVTAGEDFFFLRVQGDSMAPTLREGDLVLVRRQSAVESGSLAVVIIDGEEGLVKRVVCGPGWLELRSENPYYPPRRFAKAEMESVYIVGLVTESKRKY